MIVCPKKLLPTLSHLVKLLWIGPLAGAPPDTCISTETESGFITEDDTSPVCHTPSCRSAKSSRHCYMWGQCGCLRGHDPELVAKYETTPLWVKEDIEDVSSELGNGG
ncbi:hypothetical protein TNCV_1844551 [Trichonephila clavipes]|nr:hypothetical protein TNCV_1844551 [Trichonephila clavipes]